jgi:glycosyltransferase involved in cell wall biosynthesis
MRVIPNGFDLSRFRPHAEARLRLRKHLGLASDAEVIGMIARFMPGEKDHATFLEAAARLRRRRAGVHFLLCGRGMSSDNVKLVAEISGRGLTESVHLLGERDDIPEVTAALDVATLASLVEGFPNVVGEAMACGVPVVATDVGDCREIIGDAGIVVPPRDPEALAEAWRNLLEAGREGRERIGLRGRERVAELYELGKIVRQYEDLYEELARGVRRSCGKELENSRIDRCAASAAP